MDTVRLARDMGNVSGLLPPGIASIRDIPFQLQQAIKAALVFLSFEEMPDEDRPPRSIWLNNELLSEHLREVRRRWKRGGGGDEPERPAARNSALQLMVAK